MPMPKEPILGIVDKPMIGVDDPPMALTPETTKASYLASQYISHLRCVPHVFNGNLIKSPNTQRGLERSCLERWR